MLARECCITLVRHLYPVRWLGKGSIRLRGQAAVAMFWKGCLPVSKTLIISLSLVGYTLRINTISWVDQFRITPLDREKPWHSFHGCFLFRKDGCLEHGKRHRRVSQCVPLKERSNCLFKPSIFEGVATRQMLMWIFFCSMCIT